MTSTIKSEIVNAAKTASSIEPVELPDLYRDLQGRHGLTIGQFHDTLREMFDAREIELAGYTRAMADIAGARAAMYLDGEIMYYLYA